MVIEYENNEEADQNAFCKSLIGKVTHSISSRNQEQRRYLRWKFIKENKKTHSWPRQRSMKKEKKTDNGQEKRRK